MTLERKDIQIFGIEKYRSWLRVYAWANIVMFFIANIAIAFYYFQCRAYLKLWSDGPSENNVQFQWFRTHSKEYHLILQYSGSLDNEETKAVQLYEIHKDIYDRCEAATDEIIIESSHFYVASISIILMTVYIVNFILGVYVLFGTKNDSFLSAPAAVLILILLLILFGLECIGCHLLNPTLDERLCSVYSIARLAFFQVIVIILFLRLPHIYLTCRYTRVLRAVGYIGEQELFKREIEDHDVSLDQLQNFDLKHKSVLILSSAAERGQEDKDDGIKLPFPRKELDIMDRRMMKDISEVPSTDGDYTTDVTSSESDIGLTDSIWKTLNTENEPENVKKKERQVIPAESVAAPVAVKNTMNITKRLTETETIVWQVKNPSTDEESNFAFSKPAMTTCTPDEEAKKIASVQTENMNVKKKNTRLEEDRKYLEKLSNLQEISVVTVRESNIAPTGRAHIKVIRPSSRSKEKQKEEGKDSIK